ncbi:MAG: hypothetical protein Udaeo_07070 [Candidatus Udaeobacter sp.]|nr:MAG: hypothetical protein Udaeo_07070 [Candidatus Udaeobacter sp.]
MEVMLIASLEDCEAKSARRRLTWKYCQIVSSPVRVASRFSSRGRDGRASASEGEGVGLGEGRVRDNFRPVDDFDANPSPPAYAMLRRGKQSSPLLQGERWQKPGRSQMTINEHYPSNFSQTLPVRFFRLKASQHELLDPSATQLVLPSAENQPAWDWLARLLCRAH